MDAIDTIDWGAYAHFTFIAAKYPESIRFLQSFYFTITYVVLAALGAIVLLLFALQKRLRDALVASLAVLFAMGIIEFCRLMIPRRRPPDAQELVGVHDMLGSYPAMSVFLFMLLVILIGFALWPWLRSGVSRTIFVVVAAALTVAVAMLQFILAIHFVSDVVGGIVGAAIVGFVVAKLLAPAP